MLPVRLHEIVISDQLTLLLVTNLPDSAGALAELYEQRTHVETDLSNLKIVLGTERILARSADTFLKELLVTVHSRVSELGGVLERSAC